MVMISVSVSALSTRNASPRVLRSPAKRRDGGGVEEGGRGMEALRRLGRRVKPFEQVGVLGFLAFTAVFFLLIFYFFYSSRSGLVWPGRAASGAGGGGVKGVWGLGVEIGRSGGGGGGAGGGGGVCDWLEGQWVWDERYPLYESRDCRFLDEGFRCSENGRRDRFYTKWRWQPARCDLPRF